MILGIIKKSYKNFVREEYNPKRDNPERVEFAKNGPGTIGAVRRDSDRHFQSQIFIRRKSGSTFSRTPF
jgi:hypothetical protein